MGDDGLESGFLACFGDGGCQFVSVIELELGGEEHYLGIRWVLDFGAMPKKGTDVLIYTFVLTNAADRELQFTGGPTVHLFFLRGL